MNEKFSHDNINFPSFTDTKNSFHIEKKTITKETVFKDRNFHEIDFIINGKGKCNINGKTHILSGGEVILISPDVQRSYLPDANSELTIIIISTPIEFMCSYTSNMLHTDTVFKMTNTKYESAKHMCNVALEKNEITPDADTDDFCRACASWVLLCLESTSKFFVKRNIKSDFTSALDYIHENYNNEISRSDVAKIMHMSPSHFSRTFHNVVGISFSKYLQNLRLNNAIYLLKTTELPLSEIAHLSGFSSDSYFSKMYKNTFGITPGRSRNNN